MERKNRARSYPSGGGIHSARRVLSGIHLGSTVVFCAVVMAANEEAMGGTASKRSARVVQEYVLPPYSLTNLGYTTTELAVAGRFIPTDRPAIGSGLQWLSGNQYLSVTDRGPARKTAEKRIFPLPRFTPTIVMFQAKGGKIIPTGYLPIVVSNGGPGVTGLPNYERNDDPPFSPSEIRLPYNPNGLDVEDIQKLPDGRFLLVEEYSPSVVVVSPAGVVLKRYIPGGSTLPGAVYPVSSTLPDIFGQVRPNRGFESLALSRDGRTAYTLTQSPLGSSDGSSKGSRVLRLLRLDVRDPLDLRVTGQFIVRLGPESRYPAGNNGEEIKVSAAAWVAADKLLLLERTDEAGRAGAKLILADASAATDIGRMPVARTLELENVSTDLAKLGITPAITSEVLCLNIETPEIKDFKLEGLTILNASEVAVSNDNDFGVIGNPEARSRMWIIRLGKPLPVGVAGRK